MEVPILSVVVTKRAVARRGLSDRFELKAQAGSGGMGIVYQAIDRNTGLNVAVKILSVKSVTDVGRFGEEAQVLQDLEHPGIVRYIDHGLTSHGDPYIAMEWLEGETLEQRLARGRLPAAGVAHLAARILDALAAAHERGVVHRDIKPSNVFLVGWRLFDVRIIDFGVARRVVAARQLTRRGSTVGTPHYSSPEQARGEEDIDGRADIFSVGAVLFECLTGRTPFQGKDAQEVLTRVCLTPVPRVWEHAPGLDPELGAVIDRMLIQDRARRLADARDLAGHFREIAARLGAAEEAAAPVADDARPPAALGLTEQRVLCGLLIVPGRQEGEPGKVVVSQLAERERFTSVRVAGGSYLLTPAGQGLALDQIAEVARVATKVVGELPQACLGMALGHANLEGRTPAGGLIDRLRALGANQPGRIRLHENVARLLPPAQVVREAVSALSPAWLRLDESGELTELAPAEHQGPMLGREYELGYLEQALAKCASARSARTLLVTAEPGMGKTRLARAFLADVRSRGKGAVYFLRGRRDQVEKPGGLLRPILPLTVPGEPRSQSRATPGASATALVEWLAAHPARHPVVFVCDDLQWADRASLRLLAGAQRELSRRPILMVCFVRAGSGSRAGGAVEGTAAGPRAAAPAGAAGGPGAAAHLRRGDLGRGRGVRLRALGGQPVFPDGAGGRLPRRGAAGARCRAVGGRDATFATGPRGAAGAAGGEPVRRHLRVRGGAGAAGAEGSGGAGKHAGSAGGQQPAGADGAHEQQLHVPAQAAARGRLRDVVHRRPRRRRAARAPVAGGGGPHAAAAAARHRPPPAASPSPHRPGGHRPLSTPRQV